MIGYNWLLVTPNDANIIYGKNRMLIFNKNINDIRQLLEKILFWVYFTTMCFGFYNGGTETYKNRKFAIYIAVL